MDLCNLHILVSDNMDNTRQVDYTLPCINKVPRSGDGKESAKNDRCIIHGHRGNRQYRWHAEENGLEGNPAQGDDIHNWANNGTAIPASLRDFTTLVPQTEADRNGVADSESDDAYGDEGEEGATAPNIDDAEKHLNDGDEDQRPERHTEPVADPGPQAGKRDGIVSGKSPGCSR